MLKIFGGPSAPPQKKNLVIKLLKFYIYFLDLLITAPFGVFLKIKRRSFFKNSPEGAVIRGAVARTYSIFSNNFRNVESLFNYRFL